MFRYAALSTSFLLMIACSSGKDTFVEPPAIQFVQLDTLFIYGHDKGPFEHLLEDGVNIDLDGDGNLWALDGKGCRLHVLSPEGELKAIYGRKGEGPGEFTRAFSVTGLPDGALTWDRHNRQLCEWSLSRGLVKTTTLGVRNSSGGDVVDVDGSVWTLKFRRDEITDNHFPIDVFHSPIDGASDCLYSTESLLARSPDGRAIAFGYYSRIARSPWGGVILSKDHTYTLVWLNDADVVEWPYASYRAPYTDQDIEELSQPRAMSADDEVYAPRYEHKPDVQALFLMEDAVWVQTAVTNDQSEIRYDRVSSSGIQLGSYWLPGNWLKICKAGEVMYAVAVMPGEYSAIIGFKFSVIISSG